MKLLYLCPLAFIFNLIYSNCFRLVIDPMKMKKNEYCIFKELEEGDVLFLSYIITGGHHLEKCNTFLYDVDSKLIFEKYNEKRGSLEDYEVRKTGMYKLCLAPLSNSIIYINLDFHTLSEVGQIRNIAKDEQIKEITKETNKINNILEKLHTNVNFIMERRNIHSELINSIKSSIKFISWVKVSAIVLISLIQIYLIKTYLNSKSRTFTSVGYNFGQINTNVYL